LAKAEGFARPPVALSRVALQNEAISDIGFALRDIKEGVGSLFEPFYTTTSEGMGMGLSICRSIIEAHGGRLWAIPCEPRGALFQFTIPAD
jgi:K+-sensing histidine kinase KdpD